MGNFGRLEGNFGCSEGTGTFRVEFRFKIVTNTSNFSVKVTCKSTWRTCFEICSRIFNVLEHFLQTFRV